MNKDWECFGYNKRSRLIHWVEWSIAATILIRDKKVIEDLEGIIFWVSSSDMEYPYLPSLKQESEENIKTYFDAFSKAKKLTKELKISTVEIEDSKSEKTRRISIAKIGDRIENLLLKNTFEKVYARYAGDILIRIAIPEQFAFGV